MSHGNERVCFSQEIGRAAIIHARYLAVGYQPSPVLS